VLPRPRVEAVTLAGAAGVLEALLELPAAAAQPHGVAVICHPHPLHGGTLHNKVVHTLARAALELGYAVLRFNFRGVGSSAGSFDDGRGETDDALAAVAWSQARWPELPLLLAGFSFGGAVAIRAAATAMPAALITVAPAIDRVSVDAEVLPRCPWLIVIGDADEVVDPAALRRWAVAHASGAQLVSLPGVGHFFHGALAELQAAVLDFGGAPDKKKPDA
jgi:alpha/beta superfamily hydrolase